jgi:tripartite-type tricarboxylate transporter receptor subunit TctC
MTELRSSTKKVALFSCLMSCFLIFCVSNALAQQSKYPEKPIELLVPFGIGGGTDIAMRFISSVIPEYLGQPVVVINKAGASGSICMNYIINQAKSDGYKMMGSTVGANCIFPARFKKLPFKWDNLTFVARVQLTPMILAVRKDSPFKTLKDMLDHIRKNPGKIKFSTAGVQTTQNVGPHVLMKSAKIPFKYVTPIHYEGGGAANLALLRGDVDFIYNLAPATKPHVKSGDLRGLLVPIKIKDLPDIPSSEELGFPQMTIMGWQAIAGPPNLPDYVVRKWTDAIKKTMKNKAWIRMGTSIMLQRTG